MPHPVAAILKPEETERLLILSPTGAMTLCDTDLQIKGSRDAAAEGPELLQSWMFGQNNCEFVSAASESRTVIVLALGFADSLHVQVLSINAEDEFVMLGECEHPFKPEVGIFSECTTPSLTSLLSSKSLLPPVVLLDVLAFLNSQAYGTLSSYLYQLHLRHQRLPLTLRHSPPSSYRTWLSFHQNL